MNRETARKQTDRVKDRDAEDILWRGPRQALSDVEEVRHHKDCENRSLGRDQTQHGDPAAIGRIPLKPRSGHRH